jgi:hypothetical protein
MSDIAAAARERAHARGVVLPMRTTISATETQRRRRRKSAAAAGVAAVVCLVAAVPPAGAADRAPDKLLHAYPLEQRPTTVADAPRRRTAAARSGAAGPPRLTQGTTLLIAGAAMLLAALVVIRRRPHRAPATFAMAAGAPAVVEPPPPPVDDPPARAPRPAAVPAAVAKDGVVCQVHWRHEADTSWFAAITVQTRERRIVAESPDFARAGAQPPSRGPEAQEALQALIDDLCEAGWTPIRGRGRESGAPRWYARRFHAATEPDTDMEET